MTEPAGLMDIEMLQREEGCSCVMCPAEAPATPYKAPVANMRREANLDSRDLMEVDPASEPGAGSKFSDVDDQAGAEVERSPPPPSEVQRTSYFDLDRNDDDSDYEPQQGPCRQTPPASTMPSATPEASSHRVFVRFRAFKLKFDQSTTSQQRSRLIRINRLKTIWDQDFTQRPGYPLYPTSLAYLEADRCGLPENQPLRPEDWGTNYLKALLDLAQSGLPCVSERLKRTVRRRVKEGIYPEKEFITVLDISDVLLGRDASKIVSFKIPSSFLARLAKTPCEEMQHGTEADADSGDPAPAPTQALKHVPFRVGPPRFIMDSPWELDSESGSHSSRQSIQSPEQPESVNDLPMSDEEEEEEEEGRGGIRNDEGHESSFESNAQPHHAEAPRVGTLEHTDWMIKQWQQLRASQVRVQEYKRFADNELTTAQACRKKASRLHRAAKSYQRKVARMRRNAELWRRAGVRKARTAEAHNERHMIEELKLADVQAKLTWRG